MLGYLWDYNIFGKYKNSLISYGLNSTTTLLQGSLRGLVASVLVCELEPIRAITLTFG